VAHDDARRSRARIDLNDYHPDEQYLNVRHRPDQGTAIKNKEDGERLVALSDQLCELLNDWIADKRPDVTDDQGRKPPSRRVKVEHTGQRCAGIVIGQLDHANTVPSVRTTAIQKTVKRLIGTLRLAAHRV